MNRTNSKRGGHGYDNYLPNMRPFFMAQGPDFKSGVQVDPITNRDIYPLICDLLNITAAPNNGSMDRVATLLRRNNNNFASYTTYSYATLILSVFLDLFIF